MGIRNVCRALLPTLVILGLFTLPMVGKSRAEEPKQVPPPQRVLFDFDTPRDAKKWGSVNDGVMGGRSEGTFRVNRKGISEFSGNLSLENRGGFASVRSKPAELDLSKTDALVIRIRGDGRTYYCNLYVPTNRIAYSYRAKFDTKAERWQEVRLPLKSFQATWFGRTLSEAPAIDAKNIRSLGFLIADKKARPFKLEVDWIGATGNTVSNP